MPVLLTHHDASELTLFARLYSADGAFVQNIAMGEGGNNEEGVYTASVSGLSEGAYTFSVKDGDGVLMGTGGFEVDADGNEVTLDDVLDAIDDIPTPSGDGDTAVTSATEDVDSDTMEVETAGGDGIADVNVYAYLKSEYDADPATAVRRAKAITADDGSWGPIYLSDGQTYTIVFDKSGYTFPTTEVEV